MANFSNDKVLVALVTMFLVGAIGSTFSDFTGNFALRTNNDMPIVTTSPNPVGAGSKINVNVKVRGACVDPTVEFYFGGKKYDGTKESSGGRKADVTKKGKYKFCKGDYELDNKDSFTVSYRTRPDWDGDYYAKVYYWKDKDTKDDLRSYFRVRPKTR
jgi:hypothetical protein